jgi:hypothetical protein
VSVVTTQEPAGAADGRVMTTSLLHPAPVTVSIFDEAAPSYRSAAWGVWLHGRVAAVLDDDGLRLLVPTPAAARLALRLYAVGSVELLD